jgi:hypothetical protein
MPNENTKENDKEWSANQRKFMEWLSLPSVERDPFTQRAFADVLGVGEVTLSRWRKLPGFMAEVQNLITASLGSNYHDVMYSFQQESAKGSFPHQRMYFEMLGAYREQSDLNFKGSLAVEGGLSDDELIQRANAVIERRAKDPS